MKNLILVLAFLITSMSFAQGGGKVDAVKFRGKVTTSVRDAIDVPSGETWMIHNVTTDRIEVANENNVWESITAQLTGELRLDGYTTAERNALDVPAGEAWVIYNTTSNLVEISESNDVWVTVGDGLQEGANSVPGGVSLNQGITNSIEILPDGGAASANNPMVRIIGGNQSGAVYYLMYDDVIRWSFANSKTYTLNKDGVINPTDLADKAYVDGLDVTPDNSVSEVKIVDNAVTTSKVADNAITGAKIQSSTIERTKLAPSVSNSLDLADTAIQVDNDTQLTPTQVVAAVDSELGQTTWKTGGAGVTDGDKGDITVSNSGATFRIDADAVGSPEIVSNAVGRVELQNSAVTPEKLNASNIEQTGLVPVISVDISEFDYVDPSTFGTDDQQLTRTGNTLSLEDGGSVDLSDLAGESENPNPEIISELGALGFRGHETFEVISDPNFGPLGNPILNSVADNSSGVADIVLQVTGNGTDSNPQFRVLVDEFSTTVTYEVILYTRYISGTGRIASLDGAAIPISIALSGNQWTRTDFDFQYDGTYQFGTVFTIQGFQNDASFQAVISIKEKN